MRRAALLVLALALLAPTAAAQPSVIQTAGELLCEGGVNTGGGSCSTICDRVGAPPCLGPFIQAECDARALVHDWLACGAGSPDLDLDRLVFDCRTSSSGEIDDECIVKPRVGPDGVTVGCLNVGNRGVNLWCSSLF